MKQLALLVAVVAMLAGGGAASAAAIEPTATTTTTSTSTSTATQTKYTTRLLRAVDTCRATVTPTTTFSQFEACTRNLAAPQTGNTAEADIWRLVLDCLWLGWTPGRGDGGFDNDVVNDCLDAGGVL